MGPTPRPPRGEDPGGRSWGGSLAQDDLGGALAVHAVAAARLLDDRAHGLAHRVEGVHFVSGVPRGPSQHHSIPEFSEAP